MARTRKTLSDVARQMMSGVVQVHVEGHLDEDIRTVMNPSVRIPGFWSGSGFFVRYAGLEGYIVTNAHVVRNAVKVEISSMLTSEERFEVEVVGLVKNLEPDVALIRLTDEELLRFRKYAIKDIEYLELREGTSPSRGEEIKAIGYPVGMIEPNITGGEITNFVSGSEYSTERFVTSANDRQVHTLADLETVIEDNRGGSVLLECRNGRIGLFRVAAEAPAGQD